jgi:hypothetical protein
MSTSPSFSVTNQQVTERKPPPIIQHPFTTAAALLNLSLKQRMALTIPPLVEWPSLTQPELPDVLSGKLNTQRPSRPQ